MDTDTLLQISVSLALGLLLGLQRQRTESTIAGIRTFPFISLLGTVCAMISEVHGGWILGAGFIALASALVFANIIKLKSGIIDAGMTTEAAALLLYAVGALIASGGMAAAAVIGGTMLLLLHLKGPLHKFADAVGEHDMRAIVYFVLISMIILPVLPHGNYGPYGVWNPFKIWLMVVLIVGISLTGYVAYKLFGTRAGTALGGIIGGLISSTATTVSFARRTAANAELAPLGAFVIMTASCISLVRVLVEVGAAAPGTLSSIAPPIAVLLGVCVVIAGVMFFLSRRQKAEMPEQKNPAELKAALIFGGLYALVLVAVEAALDHFGSAGFYTVAAISGLTDMDAITLSSAELAQKGEIDTKTAWRAIMIAAISNFVFKFGTVAALGTGALTLRVAVAFAGAVAAGGIIVWLWPW